MRNLRELSGYSDETRAGSSGPPAPTMRRMPAINPDNEFFHFDFLRSLQLHSKLAMGIVLGAAVLSLGYMAKRWNNYKAQALVYVQPSPPKLLANGPAQQWPYDANTYESYIQQQIHDVTRPDVLMGALGRLPGWKGSGESDQAAADRVGSAVEVARVGSGYQISITAAAGSAEEAAQIANAVAASYIESATRELRAGDTQRIELLRDERDRVLKELASDRTEQEDLNKKLGVASVGSATADPYDDQIGAVRAELVRARTASDEAAAKLMSQAGGGVSSAAMDAEADELVASDAGLVSMKTALNKRRSDLISQMANLTPSHPQYKQDAEELAKINTSLEAMSKDLEAKAAVHIQQRLKNDLERTESVEARLNGQLGQLTAAAGSATPRLQRANDLAADINRLQNRYTAVDEQFRNLTMENNAPGAVYLSSAAMPPLHAARNTVLRNGFIVLLAGLLLGVGAALVAHNMDPRVYIAADVERVLGFAPMALLPDLYEVGTGVAEEYMLRLAAAVEHAHQQGSLNSCVFTGVTAGAGATTVSTRVSNMLEAMGRETMLVDAVGAPPPRAGEGLPHAGSDLVHSPRGSRSTALLQQMAEETNDETVVVTDTAPLLVSGETEYLSRFVDATIVVVESAVTTRAQLREVARTLQRLDVSAVGFVLNRIPLAKADPAFRHSVRAVEKHLRSQSRAFDRPAKSEAAREDEVETPRRSTALDRLRDVIPEAGREPQEQAAPVAAGSVVPRAVEEPAYSAYLGAEPAAAEQPSRVEEPVNELPGYMARHPEPVAEAELPDYIVKTPAMEEELPRYVRRAAEPERQESKTAAIPPKAVPMPAPERAHEASAREEEKPFRAESRFAPIPFVAHPMRGREPVRFVPAAESRVASSSMETMPAAEAGRASVPEAPAPARTEHTVSVMPPLPAARKQEHHEPPVVFAEAPAAEMTMPYAAAAPEPVHAVEPGAGADETVSYLPEPQQPAAATVEDLIAASAGPEANSEDLHPAENGLSVGTPDLPYSAASRLGGLRNLLVSLGIKNLHREAEFRRTAFENEPRVERIPERPVYAQPDTPAEGPPKAETAAVVTARPEIIPPWLTPEPVEREKEPVRAVNAPRVHRWDSPDDVDTLPSRRGQYRKRH